VNDDRDRRGRSVLKDQRRAYDEMARTVPRRSSRLSSMSPVAERWYQNDLLLENGTPRANDPVGVDPDEKQLRPGVAVDDHIVGAG